MSEVKTEKLSPRVTSLQLGDSGDTFTVPSGATLDINGTIDLSGATQTGINSTWKHISTTSNTSDVTQIDFEDIFKLDLFFLKVFSLSVLKIS